MRAAMRCVRRAVRLRVLLGVCVMAMVVGHAASLNATTATLGAAYVATTPACATSGVSILDGYDGSGNVNAVTVSGLASACTNGHISVTVYNGTTSTTGTGTVPSSGTITITISPVVAFNAGTETDMVITL
jgi:hypothetical protein